MAADADADAEADADAAPRVCDPPNCEDDDPRLFLLLLTLETLEKEFRPEAPLNWLLMGFVGLGVCLNSMTFDGAPKLLRNWFC